MNLIKLSLRVSKPEPVRLQNLKKALFQAFDLV